MESETFNVYDFNQFFIKECNILLSKAKRENHYEKQTPMEPYKTLSSNWFYLSST